MWHMSTTGGTAYHIDGSRDKERPRSILAREQDNWPSEALALFCWTLLVAHALFFAFFLAPPSMSPFFLTFLLSLGCGSSALFSLGAGGLGTASPGEK